jgi:hypothetical protein
VTSTGTVLVDAANAAGARGLTHVAPWAKVAVAATNVAHTNVIALMAAEGTSWPQPEDWPDPIPNQLPDSLEEELNLADSLGVQPAAPGTPEFDEMINSGKIKWAITEDGQLLAVPKFVNNQQIKHTAITRGGRVRAAGEADIAGSDGNYVGLEIDNQSGHYLPPESTLGFARRVFQAFDISFP